ncbi:MAG: hypothetical protein LIO77_08685 [Rikenellaceae bacterium]|nr:hypothetical protein [Rikenellaceae bacterium]
MTDDSVKVKLQRMSDEQHVDVVASYMEYGYPESTRARGIAELESRSYPMDKILRRIK